MPALATAESPLLNTQCTPPPTECDYAHVDCTAVPYDDNSSDAPPRGPLSWLTGLVPHGSMPAAVFNLVSATLGAGTLSIPSAMQSAGAVSGTLMLLACGTATVYSIRLLVMLVDRTGHKTYEELARHLFGKWFERLTAAMVVLFCWGITVVYVVTIGDILGTIHDAPWFPEVFKGEWGSRLLTTIFWAVFMLPLSLAKEINSLRYASMVGLVSSTVLVGAIVAHSALHGDFTANTTVARFTPDMLMAMPIFTFSFSCQTNAFEVYAELKNRSVNRMTVATAIAMYFATGLYIIAGVSGLADFGSAVDGDILKNYGNPANTWYVAMACIAISFTVTMAFPICSFPTRDAILQLIGYKDVYAAPTAVRIPVCVAMALSALVLGLFFRKIQILFGLLGGVCSSNLGFVWPALFVLRSGWWTPAEVGWGNVIGAWVLLVAGIAFGIGGTVISILQDF